jgi:hypothetical protein
MSLKGNHKTEIEKGITRMKSMMKSCFAYDGLNKENSYLQKYKVELGETIFDSVYNEYAEYLNNTFTIKRGVYSDHEGCTYNSMVEK